MKKNVNIRCSICQNGLTEKIEYSANYNYKNAYMCWLPNNYKNLKQRNSKVTNEQSMLYLAFKHRGIAAELEHQVFYDTEDTNKK
ncbi:MAG: hypothetical protein ACRC9X_01490 [Bacteroidales bacterium]